MKEPLLVLTYAVGLALLLAVAAMLLGKPVNDALIGVLSTALGGLITAVTTKKKEQQQLENGKAGEATNGPE